MIDMSESLRALTPQLREPDAAASEALVKEVHAAVGGDLQWDDLAIEDWATIGPREPRDQVTAQVYVRAPLVIVIRDCAAVVRSTVAPETEVIEVDDMDEAVLCADLTDLISVFGDTVKSEDFEAAAFSARDLWFWTI